MTPVHSSLAGIALLLYLSDYSHTRGHRHTLDRRRRDTFTGLTARHIASSQCVVDLQKTEPFVEIECYSSIETNKSS